MVEKLSGGVVAWLASVTTACEGTLNAQHYYSMAKTALITGASGLLGRQVLQAFQRAGWEAVGTGFSRPKPPTILKVDLSDSAAIEQILDKVKWVQPYFSFVGPPGREKQHQQH